MIKLSKRLSAIAKMVPKDAFLADIGCDHALVDIFLLNNHKIKFAIASDISKGAINEASKNVLKYQCQNIDLRLGDGLKVINSSDKVNTIIISGMGGSKAVLILKDEIKKLSHVTSIIIEANNNSNQVRNYLTKQGFYIFDEVILKDDGVIYTIISFKKGIKKYTNKELQYGPVIIKNKDDVFKEYINGLIKKSEDIYKSLPSKQIIKKIKLKLKIIALKKENHFK